MQHSISLSNQRVALVNEYHSEVAQLSKKREVDNWTAISVGLASLIDFIGNPPSGYAWTPDGSRVSSLTDCILNGNAIDAPVLYSTRDTRDTVTLADGRHRLFALFNLGAKKAVIMVPDFQKQLFVEFFP